MIHQTFRKKKRLASNAPNINLPCSSTVASRFSCAKVFLITRMPWLCHKPYSTSHVAGECYCGPPHFFQHLQEVLADGFFTLFCNMFLLRACASYNSGQYSKMKSWENTCITLSSWICYDLERKEPHSAYKKQGT